MGVNGQRQIPAVLPLEKKPVPIAEGAGWAPGLIWMGSKTSPPPGFDPQTVYPVASRYTDYAIPTHKISMNSSISFHHLELP
jgi:hypothetical protein